jgi:hypothetical protein
MEIMHLIVLDVDPVTEEMVLAVIHHHRHHMMIIVNHHLHMTMYTVVERNIEHNQQRHHHHDNRVLVDLVDFGQDSDSVDLVVTCLEIVDNKRMYILKEE